MKPAYAIVPALLFLGVATLYVPWAARRKYEIASGKQQVVTQANQAKEDYISGKAFVGRDGKREAETDIMRSTPKYYRYGRAEAASPFFAAICKERFGIVVDPLAGCIVSDPLVKFASDYNEEIESFISSKYGPAALGEAQKEASARWSASLKKG